MTPSSLSFTAAADGAFTFDTGTLAGTLRQDGRSIGLVPVVHKPTGAELAAGEGIFNHYRVFTRAVRYGYGARRWPSSARLAADGGVEVVWPVVAERPFELRARYDWVSPTALDLVTTVQADASLVGFEVFLASYYRPTFTDSRVWAERDGGADFVAATEELGVWQAFPRDDAGAAMIADGRWDLEPHPLSWTMMPNFAQPAAFRRDPSSGLTLLSMAERTQCFGVFTPYGEEAHYSNYFSLFGNDIAAGTTVSARSRIVVLAGPTDDEIAAEASRFFAATD